MSHGCKENGCWHLIAHNYPCLDRRGWNDLQPTLTLLVINSKQTELLHSQIKFVVFGLRPQRLHVTLLTYHANPLLLPHEKCSRENKNTFMEVVHSWDWRIDVSRGCFRIRRLSPGRKRREALEMQLWWWHCWEKAPRPVHTAAEALQ